MPQVPQLTAPGGAASLDLPRPTPDTFGASGFGHLAQAGERLDVLAAQAQARQQAEAAQAEEARRRADEKYQEKERQAASNTYVSRTLIAQDRFLAETEDRLLKAHALEPWKISAAYQAEFERNRDEATRDLTDPLLKLTVTDSLQDDFRKKSEKVRMLQAMMVQQQAQAALTDELGYRRSEFIGAPSAKDRLEIAMTITQTMARQVNVTSTKEEMSGLLGRTIHGLYVDTAASFVDQYPGEFLTGGLPLEMGDVRNQLSGEELATLRSRAVTAQTAQLKADEAQNQKISEKIELQIRLATYDPDPAQRQTAQQVEAQVAQLVGRPGAMRATEAAKLVQETRDIERKVGPDNVRAYNEAKALIDANPFAVTRSEIIANADLSQGRTRELLAYQHTKETERSKTDHFTNQPAYKDKEDQLRLDYETSLFGIPTKSFARAHARLAELTDPKGTFKLSPDQAYRQIRQEISVSIGTPPLKMLNESLEQGLKRYEAGALSVQELARLAAKESPAEQVKLYDRIREIDRAAEQQGFTDINALKPKAQKRQ